MVYIDNNLEEQHVFIPRNDNQGSYESSYDKAYQDGYSDGLEDAGDCQLQDKEVILTATTQTITADEGYVGMERVFVDGRQLAVEKYTEGYHDGEDDGREDQKSKLVSTAFTSNGIYTREDGWNEVEVEVPQSACALQDKSLLLNSGDTSPWTVEPSSGYDGMSSVTVSDNGYGQSKYDQGKEDGHAEGMDDQKALLSSTTFTQNGEYSREDGWSAVTVNVAQTGTACTLETQKVLNLNSGDAGVWTVVPSSGYDGMAEVLVQDQGYGAGQYSAGVADGENNVRSAMTSTAFTQNDTYQNASGWSAVTVNVQPNLENASYGLESGFTGTTVTPSSGYDGIGSVEIYDDGYGQEKYNEGYQDGLGDCPAPTLEQKNVTLTAITQTVTTDNGYDGMSAVTVDASGLCQDYYDDGYEDGFNDGESTCTLQSKEVTLTATTQTILPNSDIPSAPNGEDVYGGNITDFLAKIDYGECRVYSWDDSGHTDSTEIGWFTQDRSTGDFCFYNYQGGVNYIIMGMTPENTDLTINSWTEVYNGLYLYYDKENLWFYGSFANGYYIGGDDLSNFVFDPILYVGMDSVTVDATDILNDKCQECYNEGYQDGSAATCNIENSKTVVITATTQSIYPTGTKPSAPHELGWGTVYGGNITDFEDACISNNRLTINLVGLVTTSEYGWFTIVNNELIFHDSGGNVDYTITGQNSAIAQNEWVMVSEHSSINLYVFYDGQNVWFANNNNNSMTCNETDISNLILTSDAYSGIYEVNTNASALCQSYYDSGYTSGHTDGMSEQKALLVSTAITQNGVYTREDGWNEVTVMVPSSSACNLQNKTVTVTSSNQTIFPDSGYDGMSSVTLDCSTLTQRKYKEGMMSVVNSLFTGNGIGVWGYNAIGYYTYGIVTAYYYTPIQQECLLCGYDTSNTPDGSDDIHGEAAFSSMSVNGGNFETPTRFRVLDAGWTQIRFIVADPHLEAAFAHNFSPCDGCYMDALKAVSLPEANSNQSGVTNIYRTFQNNTGLKIVSSSLRTYNTALNGCTNLTTIYSHYTGSSNVSISGTNLPNSGVLYYPEGKASTHSTPAGWTKIELF